MVHRIPVSTVARDSRRIAIEMRKFGSRGAL
jgi:hypothetical protein